MKTTKQISLKVKNEKHSVCCPKCGSYCYEPGHGRVQRRSYIVCGWNGVLVK